MPLMQGKRGLILGLANEYSLAWGIARALWKSGAELAFTYPNEVMKKRVHPLADSLGAGDHIYPCDVSCPQDIDTLCTTLKSRWGSLDFVLHAVAFAEKEDLKAPYMQTPKENFLKTMDISCYSLTHLVRGVYPLMSQGGSILTLTYGGATRVMPHYNVMGVAKAALEASVRYLAMDLGSKNIRINALSAGPMKTLAASGIGDFRKILHWNRDNAPLRRNVLLEEVGNSGLYLLSPLSTAVTGEVHYVDCGYHVVGMKAIEEEETKDTTC